MSRHHRSDSRRSKNFAATFRVQVAKGALIAIVLSLLPLLATRATAASCNQGCKKAQLACSLAAKAEARGCLRICFDAFLASDHGVEARETFAACKTACHDELRADRDACRATLESCGSACDANPVCSAVCGDSLNTCAQTVLSGTRSCLSGCSSSDGACVQACGSPGSVGAHHGFAAIDDCYNNSNNGFAVCMSGGCTSVCGNGVLEPGESCDDFNTSPNDGCSATCAVEDLDGDGINDDGDGNGIPGDAPCAAGNTANCDDNCPFVPDPTQADADGDGVGDLCDYNCTGASGALIEGGVYLNSIAPANVLPGSQVTACNGSCCSRTVTDANGAYQFVNLVPGTYTVLAQPSGNVLPGSIGPFVVSGNQTFNNQNIIRSGPQAPPLGTTLTGGSSGGIPSVYPGADQTLTTTGCVNGSAVWTVIHPDGSTVSGSMSEDPVGSGNYTALLTATPPTFAFGGANQITIDISCPDPLDNLTILFDVYIDPSGFTRYLDGNPAAGATVTLSRSENPLGPFAVVPDGSNIMSPKNRTNPDVSDPSGHFGWDVIAGYYKVRAEINGCVAESAVLTIPPAVTDLDLVFECPCVAGPKPSCRTAAKGKLTISQDPADDSKDTFLWKWSRGQATTQTDLGAPLSATDYDVCIYASSTAPLAALSVPADPMLWQTTGATGTKGFRFDDADGLSSGVTKVLLVSSATDFARIQVKGRGALLPHPTLGNLPVPITVQLQRSDSGLCFESTFDLNDVITNTAARLNVRVQ